MTGDDDDIGLDKNWGDGSHAPALSDQSGDVVLDPDFDDGARDVVLVDQHPVSNAPASAWLDVANDGMDFDENKMARADRIAEALDGTATGDAVDAMPLSVQAALRKFSGNGINVSRVDSLLRLVAREPYVSREDAIEAGQILAELGDEQIYRDLRYLRGL